MKWGSVMKKFLSVLLTVCIIIATVSCCFGLQVFAEKLSLSDEQIAAKNYPLPTGYVVSNLYGVYDTSVNGGNGTLCKEEGNFYDTSSLKIVSKQGAYEKVGVSNVKLDGVGFMFWYKTDIRHTVRIRRASDISIIAELYLDPCSEGRWVTFYYYGSYTNCYFKGDMNSDIRKNIKDTEYNVQFMTSTGNKTIYIDEFYTFKAGITPADSYENDDQAYKFSLNRFVQGSKYVTEYEDDGSTTISSTYGSSANKNPFSILYNADAKQFALAVNKAKQGSGYLQMQLTNLNCVNSSGKEAYALANITFNGINKTIKQYIYGSGTTETLLLRVDKIENPEDLTTIRVEISGSEAIKDVKFKFSPLTVFYYPEDEIILQAENLNPKINYKTDATIGSTSDGNRTYVYNNSTTSDLTFELPELAVGEYYVYAGIYAKVCSTKYHFIINNLRKYTDIPFTDKTYSSQFHNTLAPIGTIQITKDYSDGPTFIRMMCTPKATAEIRIDYFSFKMTDTAVQAEPSSNFEIKDYPEMKDYEVKSILSTFNDYVCGTDNRYYLTNQLAGYVADGNAFNLNSRGTMNWAYSDNNVIWNGGSKYLDGDGIRFWFKGSGGTIQFLLNNYTVKYTYGLPWTSGVWITIYYKDLVANGDLSDINRIYYKTGNNKNANYIDELHTIQEKLGEVTYELNGDGTASVVGYNLRLEEVNILSEYKGCPVTTIKAGALSKSLTLKSVNIPDTVKIIENDAFANNPNLATVTFGSNLTSIGENAFKNCEKLTNLTVPEKVSSISDTAFSGCKSLFVNINSEFIKEYCRNNLIDYKDEFDNVEYYYNFNTETNNVEIIGYSGIDDNLTIPQRIDETDVTSLGAECFKDNLIIKKLTLPDTVVSIKKSALSGATALEKVTTNSVQTIDENAFYGCTSLKEVAITNSVLKIKDNAFYGCSGIEEFYFSDNLTSIGTNAFYNCDFVADLSDTAYETRDSYSYKYVQSNKYVNYPTTNSDFEYFIVDEIATICGYKGASAIITIPTEIDGYALEKIDKNAFKNNKNITTVVFKGGVRIIDEYAFYGCSNLSKVTFADSLRKILGYSFANCSSLKKVEINDVVSVHENAFDSTTIISRVQTDFIRNALDYVDGMTVGWNLGNTLDAHSTENSYGDITVYQHEHMARWYDYITQDLFNLVGESFNTIRIPITWNAFINPNDDYKIDKEFMDRIQEVVDMCYTAGFEYIIINTHHDSDYYFNVHPSNPNYNNAEYILGRVWQQICERFEDYDEKLIFESMNEIRAQDLTTTADGNGDWYGHDTTYFDKLNSLNQKFYEVVRASGGNNPRRYLMIQTYGGQKDFHQINKLWLPSVKTDDHIIPSVHWYIESTNPAHYYATLDGLTQKFLDKGMPCVIGEIGLARWINDDQREIWANNAFTLFENYRIKAIIWEDHGDYSTITYKNGSYSWTYPKYIETINALTKKNEVDVENECIVYIDNDPFIRATSNQSVVLPVSDKENFVAYTDGENYYFENDSITVTEDVYLQTLYLGEIAMLKGASMRLDEKGGIRYYTKVDAEKIQYLKQLGITVQLGTLISPKDLLQDKDFTFENVTVWSAGATSKYNCLNVIFDSEEYYQDGNVFVGSISNVLDSNIDREFSGRGYVKVSVNGVEKVYYADYFDNDIANNTRTLRGLANCIYNDDKDVYNSFKTLLDYYINY